jgi:hypothetical protein
MYPWKFSYFGQEYNHLKKLVSPKITIVINYQNTNNGLDASHSWHLQQYHTAAPPINFEEPEDHWPTYNKQAFLFNQIYNQKLSCRQSGANDVMVLETAKEFTRAGLEALSSSAPTGGTLWSTNSSGEQSLVTPPQQIYGSPRVNQRAKRRFFVLWIMTEPRRRRGRERRRQSKVVKVSPPQWVTCFSLWRSWAPHLLRYNHENNGTNWRIVPPQTWMMMNWRIIVLP